jgi:conjugative transfer signal peptidase TraF
MTRRCWATLTCLSVLSVTLPGLVHPAPKLIWNASASVPIGLYAVHPAGTLRVTELVVVRPPEPLAAFLDQRRYLPKGVPLLKRVLALAGQIVCRNASTITVDGIAMGDALEHDSRGRPLPVWQGCRRIASGEVFLMNRQSKASLDGRYFGSLPATAIVGRAVPLWTDKDD